jgi:hypothetical protein
MKYIPIILAATTITICFVLLYYISFTTLFNDRLFGQRKVVLQCILGIYILFRGYKAFVIFKRKE